jgi:hypothetical protein
MMKENERREWQLKPTGPSRLLWVQPLLYTNLVYFQEPCQPFFNKIRLM